MVERVACKKHKEPDMQTSPAAKLLADAVARIESASIRAWATSDHNEPIWLKIAGGSYRKNGGGQDAILRLSTYIVLTAMG
jgi:hypothetical protein